MVVSGLLSLNDTREVLSDVAGVLVFLVAVTVLAGLSGAAGVFDVAAHEAAHLARGRTLVLFLLVAAIAVVTTSVLSLDTTAVLLTPVVLALCAQLRLDPLPFAMATVWLANTASLLLPVSNLTNLLALGQLGLSPAQFAAQMWAPALASAAVTTGVLLLLYRRRIRGRYRVPPHPGIADRVLFGVCTAACVAFTTMVLAEVPVAVAATAGAAAALAAFAVRRPEDLRWSLLPWRLVILVVGLFLLVETAGRSAVLTDGISALAGTGSSFPDLVQLAAVAALGANAVNNLPAYLALEPVTGGSPDRLLATLVGVNAGPLVLLWGSLATLLWHDRCRAQGLHISARYFAATGLLLLPPLLLATVAALSLS